MEEGGYFLGRRPLMSAPRLYYSTIEISVDGQDWITLNDNGSTLQTFWLQQVSTLQTNGSPEDSAEVGQVNVVLSMVAL
jgi:hypothetical protein